MRESRQPLMRHHNRTSAKALPAKYNARMNKNPAPPAFMPAIEPKPASTTTATPFRSLVRYDPQRMHVAAMYCSDGRVGDHFDDFLQNGLGLPRYDRIALPGGPACL